jgi:RNA polymerase sigma-70 factor (ECF subfamily)
MRPGVVLWVSCLLALGWPIERRTPGTERAATARTPGATFPADLREAIILCEWQGLSAAQAAAIIDATPKAEDNRLQHARNFLRVRLKRCV